MILAIYGASGLECEVLDNGIGSKCADIILGDDVKTEEKKALCQMLG